MQRTSTISTAAVAGLALVLGACSGESPTSPKPNPTPGGGACTVTVTLPAGPVQAISSKSTNALVGNVIRATVTKNGAAVADNTSVDFTIASPAFFAENGLLTLTKSTKGGVAEISASSLYAGTVELGAKFECGSAAVQVAFSPCPDCAPFLSSINPNTGSALGGETVTISGGGFTDFPLSTISFGGAKVSPTGTTNTSITAKTPPRTLADLYTPEKVDVCAQFYGGVAEVCLAKAYTYVGIDPSKKIFISSISPASGSQSGNEAVTIQGGNFGTSAANVYVTFCGLPATLTSVGNTSIGVLTPAHQNSNPALSEACDVSVSVDQTSPLKQTATLPQGFVYRGGGGGGACNTDPSLFISTLSPGSGPADGGTVVALSGGGFPTNPANVRVDFGGTPATVTSVTASSIGVVTPRRTLANPGQPEVVDVTVTDLGSVSQRCARLTGAFTYTPQALTPTIYSISPTTGPNDAATRVTIFGTGFQFPMQVFMTGGGCGTQRIEVPLVSPVTLTQLVVETPRAVGAYACLAGSQVDVQVLNPTTGKSASCAGCFKYYGCPAAIAATPNVLPTGVTTPVVVSGNNFEEPVVATFEIAGYPAFPLTVSSVSSTSVVVQMPPLSTIAPGLPACQSYTGNIRILSTNLASCSATSTSVTYRADTPTISSFSPTSATQPGGTSVTVLGSGFGSSMTAAVTKNGVVVGSPIVASVTSSGSLSFTTPYIPDSSFNRQNCTGGGTQAIPTTFGVRVTNTLSGCSNDLSGLVITPTNTACVASLAITTSSLPAATLCASYAVPIVVAGGTAPYFFTGSGYPAWLTINSTSGILAGTPNALVPAGPGTGGAFTISPLGVNVADSGSPPGNTSRTYSLLVNDPGGPFSIGVTGPPIVTFTQAAGGSVTLTASPNPTPAGFGPVNWAFEAPGAPAGFSLSAVTGQSVNVLVAAGTATGTYNVTLRATDTSCAVAARHTATVNLQVTVTP